MTKLFRRLSRGSSQIAAWYSSPTGALSALALLLALGLSATGFPGPAVWVLVAWLGALLPYKLNRERADRSQQVAALAQSVHRVESELTMTPTVGELAEWQEAIERQTAALDAKAASLDQIGEALRMQREAT